MILAAALLPDRAGLVLLFAVVGGFGGICAAAHGSNDHGPSLWAVCQRAIVGLGMGLAAGCLGLAYLSESPSNFFYTALGSFVSGFAGPVWAWQLGQTYLKLKRPDVPQPPSPFQQPPTQGDKP